MQNERAVLHAGTLWLGEAELIFGFQASEFASTGWVNLGLDYQSSSWCWPNSAPAEVGGVGVRTKPGDFWKHCWALCASTQPGKGKLCSGRGRKLGNSLGKVLESSTAEKWCRLSLAITAQKIFLCIPLLVCTGVPKFIFVSYFNWLWEQGSKHYHSDLFTCWNKGGQKLENLGFIPGVVSSRPQKDVNNQPGNVEWSSGQQHCNAVQFCGVCEWFGVRNQAANAFWDFFVVQKDRKSELSEFLPLHLSEGERCWNSAWEVSGMEQKGHPTGAVAWATSKQPQWDKHCQKHGWGSCAQILT